MLGETIEVRSNLAEVIKIQDKLRELKEKASTVTNVGEFDRIIGDVYTLGWRICSPGDNQFKDNPFFRPPYVNHQYRVPQSPQIRKHTAERAFHRGSDDFHMYQGFCTTDD